MFGCKRPGCRRWSTFKPPRSAAVAALARRRHISSRAYAGEVRRSTPDREQRSRRSACPVPLNACGQSAAARHQCRTPARAVRRSFAIDCESPLQRRKQEPSRQREARGRLIGPGSPSGGSVVSGKVSQTCGRLVSGVFGIPMDVAVWGCPASGRSRYRPSDRRSWPCSEVQTRSQLHGGGKDATRRSHAVAEHCGTVASADPPDAFVPRSGIAALALDEL